jgi:hypothetical protein
VRADQNRISWFGEEILNPRGEIGDKGQTTIFLVSQNPSLLQVVDQTVRLRGGEQLT